MRDTAYIRFDRHGIIGLTKREPALKSGEFAVRLRLGVDDAYFRQITPTVDVDIDDSFIIEPRVDITAEPRPADPEPESET